jgi:hypothetical protein
MDIVDWTGGDDFEEKPCPALLNTTIELTYDAVLGFTKALQEDKNPVQFVLSSWEDGTDLTTERPSGDYEWWDLPFRTASLS